jgi:glycosyltransferase involved in cell wall biosynthesis
MWFSNTPANAIDYLKDGAAGSGGWLKSLDKALQDKVDLHIAFYYPKKDSVFKYLNTTYYPFCIKNWKAKAIINTLFPKFTNLQDLPLYLDTINLVRPDLIHIHGTENPFSCIIPHVKFPVVVSIQGCMTVIHHKFQSGFKISELREGCIDLNKSLKNNILRKSFVRSYKEAWKMAHRERQNLIRGEFIIGRTDWDRRIATILAPGCTYYHCDELIRVGFYNRNWKVPANKIFTIHTTTGNSPYKGFETICETLFELNNIPAIKVEWQIAGISEYDNIVKLTRRKLRNRFPKNGLVFLGKLDENELIDKLCYANLYVSPSHIENSSNSLCEAMLMGMPCIATFAGGTGSIIKNGEEGLLVQDGDPWVLAGAILELIRNQELASKYGMNARKRACFRHNPEKVITDLLNIYSGIIFNHSNK